jgi:hypothetical protein
MKGDLAFTPKLNKKPIFRGQSSITDKSNIPLSYILECSLYYVSPGALENHVEIAL